MKENRVNNSSITPLFRVSRPSNDINAHVHASNSSSTTTYLHHRPPEVPPTLEPSSNSAFTHFTKKKSLPLAPTPLLPVSTHYPYVHHPIPNSVRQLYTPFYPMCEPRFMSVAPPFYGVTHPPPYAVGLEGTRTPIVANSENNPIVVLKNW
eukprot:TRINITY_DN5512_c0_g1_i2.p1 TRINITY_DN5512_c0_g1~~TRINITY_DN5512_c0_g1_i2.p1  ORF type:complete len:151 (+),score=12.51 TRINITY_DN5512_c0_g1_i2:103-555(+)